MLSSCPLHLYQTAAALLCHMCDSHIKIIGYSRKSTNIDILKKKRSVNHPDINNKLLSLHNSYNDRGGVMLQMTVEGCEHMPLWEGIN